MQITTTYNRLVLSKDALEAVNRIKGLKPGDKMLYARIRRQLAGDLQDIEDIRTDLAKKYVAIGHKRLKDQVLKQVEDMDDPEAKKKAEAAAEAIAEPTGVLEREMPNFQIEYTKHLEEEVTVTVSQRIVASKIANAPEILSDHLFALDWLLEDDISPPEEKQAQGETAASSPPAPAAAVPLAPVPEPQAEESQETQD